MKLTIFTPLKKALLSMAFIALCLFPIRAQRFEETTLGIKTVIDTFHLEVQFYGPNTVRIIKYPVAPKGTIDSLPEKQSLSVVKTPEKTSFKVQLRGNEVWLSCQERKLSVNLEHGQIVFYNHGKKMVAEKRNGVSFQSFNDVGNSTYTVTQVFALEPYEHIYGLGQQQQGKMSQRNVQLNMIQGNTDDYIPFFQSSRGYGVFWDNYSPTRFEDCQDSTFFRSQVGDMIDYYFLFGENADGVVAAMRDLTGQVPMFPLWSYGFWQSRERYKSQEELLEVLNRYRSLGVPLDGIIQDWQYWGDNYQWNAMDFLNPTFDRAQEMIDEVHRQHAHIAISVWNSFGPKTKPYRELDSLGALFNFRTWPPSGLNTWPPDMRYPSGVRVYDAFNPQARDIYWKYLNAGLLSKGIDAWWIDSSEPDHLDFKDSDLDEMTYLGSFRKVRNAFPLMTVGGVVDHQWKQSTDKDKRVFVLTRSAFAGQQRYGANLWSGDVTASWEALHNQISAGLNVSLCGLPYWNSDIGGFFLSRFKDPLHNPDYRELYVRWMQFGCFCPMMRSHGEGSPREIYQFGEKGDPIYDAIQQAIELRYRLLPYIYASSWDVTAHQSSMMRALVMDFVKDKQTLNINDEFMFGKSLLVCPVTKNMYTIHGQADFGRIKSRELYLPAGTDWYDFWTGERFNGGQSIKKESPIHIVPLYVKAGSILPIGPEVQYATEKPWDQLEIKVYSGANGRFVLYEDEFDNYSYQQGAYSEIVFLWNEKSYQLTIEARKGSFPGMLTQRKFQVVLSDGQSKTVDYKGKKLTIRFKKPTLSK